jgi:DNA invertase Pin-like site-specific DNA recombinase
MTSDTEAQRKVRADHLQRTAFIYIRQSTLHQVTHNKESTERQYALRQRAVALGWPIERVVVIDSDLGQSGASAVDREGFKKLVAEVGMGNAGIVIGLEVSRLARNSSDWHRLLEICGLTDTLILDEDGLYDPSHFNDRLLLGLKGAMSEAELHVLRARLIGGMRNKARKGELRIPVPIGMVYDENMRVVKDPDIQVQQAVETIFQVYHRQVSALAVVRHFNDNNLLFPQKKNHWGDNSPLVWGKIQHHQVVRILRNPRYAGAYVYGRHKKRVINGRTQPIEQQACDWMVLLPDSNPSYISWEQYQANRQRLHDSAEAYGKNRRRSPPRQGPSLLQGMVICGACGRRMTVRYHQRAAGLACDYMCQAESTRESGPICQSIPGQSIDLAISKIVLETFTKDNVGLAVAIQGELHERMESIDKLRKKQVERARYEANLAQARFMRVDPNNRLVADSLEADWNAKLRALNEAQESYERQRAEDLKVLSAGDMSRVKELTTSFPKLWSDQKVTDQDRKRMLRLLIEDVALTRSDAIKVDIRFKGGASRTLSLPPPKNWCEMRSTDESVIAALDELLNTHTDAEAAAELNRRGMVTGTGIRFHGQVVARLRTEYKLKSRFDHLRETGLLTAQEIADQLGVTIATIRIWQRHGLVTGTKFNEKEQYLYQQPGANPPMKKFGWKLSERPQAAKSHNDPLPKVHHEA